MARENLTKIKKQHNKTITVRMSEDAFFLRESRGFNRKNKKVEISIEK